MAGLQETYALIAERWLVFASALIALFGAWFVPLTISHVRMSAIPLVGEGSLEKRRQAYLDSSKNLYKQGYQMFKNGLFRIKTSSRFDTIVLSSKYLPELKKLPDSVLSVTDAVNEFLESKYTGINLDNPLIASIVKTQLTPALTRLNAVIAQEVGEALQIQMPAAEDWTEIDINSILTRVVAMASGRIFVGPELCRDDVYLASAINYSNDVMNSLRAVQKIRPWLRPWVARWQPEVKQVRLRQKEAHAILRPIVAERKRLAKDPSWQKPDDMLQWLIDADSKSSNNQINDLANIQLLLIFAAIFTTTLTATNLFYDMASAPDIADQLREDIREALANNGGNFTSSALQSMKMVDSALKETLRFNSPGHSGFQRKVLQPFTLSDGQAIPAGVLIEMPIDAINSDAEFYPEADKFDPLRFYNLRKKARDEGFVELAAQNQFVSVSPHSLTFGYGRHACPGRFFAANEIKMIVAQALARYDFRLSDGSSERYPNIDYPGISVPDESKRLLCRARKTG